MRCSFSTAFSSSSLCLIRVTEASSSAPVVALSRSAIGFTDAALLLQAILTIGRGTFHDGEGEGAAAGRRTGGADEGAERTTKGDRTRGASEGGALATAGSGTCGVCEAARAYDGGRWHRRWPCRYTWLDSSFWYRNFRHRRHPLRGRLSRGRRDRCVGERTLPHPFGEQRGVDRRLLYRNRFARPQRGHAHPGTA